MDATDEELTQLRMAMAKEIVAAVGTARAEGYAAGYAAGLAAAAEYARSVGVFPGVCDAIRALAPSAPPDVLDALTRAIATADGWGVPNDHHRALGEAAFAAVERTWDATPPPSDIPDDVRAAVRYLRPEVLAFALLMEKKLRVNDGKGGWSSEDPFYLLDMLESEARELRATCEMRYKGRGGRDDASFEAADVANFAMMVADVSRKLTLAAVWDAIRAREAGR